MNELFAIIVQMQNIYNLIGVNINEMPNAR